MYRWKDYFTKELLDNSYNLVANIMNINLEEKSISANVRCSKMYDVSISFEDNRISSFSCSCEEDSPCIHIASLFWYVERFGDDYEFYDKSLKLLVDNVDESSLRNFIFNELLVEEPLREKFLNLKNKQLLLDKDYYHNKLNHIIECGEVGEFELHGSYDLRIIGKPLEDFILEDIYSLINVDEDIFACELLNDSAFLLQDEVTMACDEWYDCAEVYCECADNILIRNDDNPDEAFEKLLENTFKISSNGL